MSLKQRFQQQEIVLAPGDLVANGSNEAFRDRMFDFSGLNEVLGTDQLLARGKRFENIKEKGAKHCKTNNGEKTVGC